MTLRDALTIAELNSAVTSQIQYVKWIDGTYRILGEKPTGAYYKVTYNMKGQALPDQDREEMRRPAPYPWGAAA